MWKVLVCTLGFSILVVAILFHYHFMTMRSLEHIFHVFILNEEGILWKNSLKPFLL